MKKLDIPDSFPIAHLEDFLQLVEEAQKKGFGKIVFEVTVQFGGITLIAVSKNETFKIMP